MYFVNRKPTHLEAKDLTGLRRDPPRREPRFAGNRRLLRLLVKTCQVLILVALLAACRGNTGTALPAGTTASPGAGTTSIVVTATPSVTSVPLAALVNGQGITLAEYEAELLRFQQAASEYAAGTPAANPTSSEADKKRLLDDLVDQVLLAQGAAEQHPLEPDSAESGLLWDKTAVEERLAKLNEQASGTQAFQDWLAANYYSAEDFKITLSRAIAAAWMRDQIIAVVPTSGEQIHARQIMLYNAGEANNVLARLQAGEKFEDLAAQYDPVGLGELGWFPKGYLLEPELEAVVFALQPEEYTQLLQTRLGYHIIQVVEREPQRPFDPDALLTLQMKAVQDWLATRHSQGKIKILVP
ncbi:MAG: peptidylprolyl isomerase [Anaerolineales bacterium]|nr:peptidylprolyl isomerase [Anaerolineales bacterium]